MTDKLPYELTAGVTATREGLEVCADMAIHFGLLDRANTEWVIPWPDAAERLRYRDGEPWAHTSINRMIEKATIECSPHDWPPDPKGDPYLHRIATILCDDAEAFYTLHWCVTNLGQEADG